MDICRTFEECDMAQIIVNAPFKIAVNPAPMSMLCDQNANFNVFFGRGARPPFFFFACGGGTEDASRAAVSFL